MDCLTDVYNRIVEDYIELFNFRSPSTDAATIQINNTYGIFIDYEKFNNQQEEFCALAHEYGHCKAGATHQLYSPHQLIYQHEYRADYASVHTFLPLDMLQDAFLAGYTETWQIAEVLGMPETFVMLAIKIYKRKGVLN